jgi:hypothetical protein
MIKTAILTFALAAATATSAAAGSAYLSRTGTGATCTLATPCATMFAAVNVAGAGGTVICLDKGDYGTLGLGIPITIHCGDGLWESPGNLLVLAPPAGGDVVVEGFAGVAIQFLGQGALHLHRARLGKSPNAGSHGLLFAPTGPATLHVSESVFYNNTGSGVHVAPTGNGYANVHVRDVKFERNANGLFADGSASTVGINVNVTASVFAENSGNGIGAFSTAGHAGVTASVKDSQITGNLTNGLGALGATASGAGSATIAVGGSMISANVNGIAASGAGQIRTFGNNQLLFNGSNGAFTGSVGLQ